MSDSLPPPELDDDVPEGSLVLLVDDDEPKRYTIARTLKREGYAVQEAATGTDALRLATGGPTGKPDLIILDVHLPDVDGLEVCRRLKAEPETAATPVLHLSAVFVDSEARTRGLDSGADGYLNQSAEPSELLATVRALLRARRAEEAARASSRGWRATFDAIRDGICLTDKHGTILRCNAALGPVLGQPDGKFPGRTLDEALPAAWNRAAGTSIQSGASSQKRDQADDAGKGQPHAEPPPLRCGDRWLRIAIDPILDEDGRPDGEVCVVSDVTERHRMIGQLRERATALAEEHRRKDEFLAMLAHELRNPLSPIKNAAALLSEGDGDRPVTAERQEMCSILTRQVDHLARLVDDLLDVSRIVRGKIELRRERVDLGAAVTVAVEVAGPLIQEQNHRLTVTLPPEPIWVNGDAVRLAQILSNLLTNAAKYMAPGGSIRVTAERHTDDVGGEESATVAVSDEGFGIPPEVLPHVFDLFVQGETTIERARGGLGIGLTLVKRLAVMHGGTVAAESLGVGQGSAFTLKLPILPAAPAPADADPAAAGTATGTAASPAGGRPVVEKPVDRPLRVLVIEDNRASALVMSRLIERYWGYEVRTAADGTIGLEFARTFQPDLVLCDIGLPGMSGYDVAKRLRADKAADDVLLVALTGYGSDSDRRQSAEAGFDRHLVKPAGVEELKTLFLHPKLRSPH